MDSVRLIVEVDASERTLRLIRSTPILLPQDLAIGIRHGDTVALAVGDDVSAARVRATDEDVRRKDNMDAVAEVDADESLTGDVRANLVALNLDR